MQIGTWYLKDSDVLTIQNALAAAKEPPSYLSPAAKFYIAKFFKLTKAGEIQLVAFPEEAIAYAGEQQKDLSMSKAAYLSFLANCRAWCDKTGVKPHWRNYYQLKEIFTIPDNAEPVMIPDLKEKIDARFHSLHNDEPARISSSGTNPRAEYHAPHYKEESIEKYVHTVLAHLVCLFKYSTDKSLLTMPGYKHPRNVDSLYDMMQCPPLKPEHKEYIESHEQYKEAIANFPDAPQWKKHVIFGQYLSALGEIHCHSKHCASGTLGMPLNTVDDYRRAHNNRR